MSLRFLSVSSIYPGYLELFYNRHPNLSGLSYKEHNDLLLSETTEFAGSYLRNFRKLGINAECIIANDNHLIKKWGTEKGISHAKTDQLIIDIACAFSPDILWIENLSFVTPELLQYIRKKVNSIQFIVATHCAPFNSRVLDSLKGVDFVITCTPGLKSYLESLGLKAFLVYHGFDTDLLDKINNESEIPANDFIFSGSLVSGGEYHNARINLLEKIIKERIHIGLYVNLEHNYKIWAKQSVYVLNTILKKINLENIVSGSAISKYGKTWAKTYSSSLLKHKKPPIYGLGMLNLFCTSKIVLNYHIGVAGDFAGNMRMFEVTGVGSCLLTDNKKNMSDLFNTETEVVVYDGAEDCISKIKWLLDNEDERQKIAMAGHQKTLKCHTVENRCREIVEIIGQELKVPGNKK